MPYHHRSPERGSVVALVALALAGVATLGYVYGGPVLETLRMSREIAQGTRAIDALTGASRVLAMEGSYINAANVTLAPAPDGGGQGIVPAASTAAKSDPWGGALVYCAWDNGPASPAAGYLRGKAGAQADVAGALAFALIAPGADRVVESGCVASDGSTSGTVNRAGDDMVHEVTVAELVELSASKWQTVDAGLEYDTIDKNVGIGTQADALNKLSVGGDTRITGSLSLGSPLSLASGGTGATAAAGARTNLGAGVTGDALFQAADPAGGRTTLGFSDPILDKASPGAIGATTPGAGTFSTMTTPDAQITGGAISGITDLAVTDGGTGASDAATARANLGANDASNLDTGTLLPARLPALSGDVSSAAGSASLTVTGLQGLPVGTAAPGAGSALVWDGAAWVPGTPTDATNAGYAVSAGDANTLDGLDSTALVKVATGQTISAPHVFTSSEMQLSHHVFMGNGWRNMNGRNEDNTYLHFFPFGSQLDPHITQANLRVRDGSGGVKALEFGGDGWFAWDGNPVWHSNAWSTDETTTVWDSRFWLVRNADAGGNWDAGFMKHGTDHAPVPGWGPHFDSDHAWYVTTSNLKKLVTVRGNGAVGLNAQTLPVAMLDFGGSYGTDKVFHYSGVNGEPSTPRNDVISINSLGAEHKYGLGIHGNTLELFAPPGKQIELGTRADDGSGSFQSEVRIDPSNNRTTVDGHLTVVGTAHIDHIDQPAGWRKMGAFKYRYAMQLSNIACSGGRASVNIGGPWSHTRDQYWAGTITVQTDEEATVWNRTRFIYSHIWGHTWSGNDWAVVPIAEFGTPNLTVTRNDNIENEMYVSVNCSTTIRAMEIAVDVNHFPAR